MPVREIRHPATSELELAHVLRTVGDPMRLAIVSLRRDDLEETFPGLLEVLVA
jgi:hypothetical protein